MDMSMDRQENESMRKKTRKTHLQHVLGVEIVGNGRDTGASMSERQTLDPMFEMKMCN